MRSKPKKDQKETKPLILVVEDCIQNLQILGKNLESEGYDIAISNNGEDAINTAKKIQPDIILLDVMMPGELDGYKVCEILKKYPETQRIPIIFLTAMVDPDDIAEGFKKGASDYTFKPFCMPELLARISNHLKVKVMARELELLHVKYDDLFSIICNDFKLQLNEIISLSKAASAYFNSNTHEDLKNNVQSLQKTSTTLYSALENIIDWVGVHQEQTTFEPTVINLKILTDSVVDHFKNQWQSKSLSIENQIEKSISVFADHHVLFIVLKNIFNNAIKFSLPEGKITLTVEPAQENYRIIVKDEGIGIEKEVLETLFTDKRHTREGTLNEKGVGLGLALCHDLVKKNGSKIEVFSTPGKGSTFCFTLPMAKFSTLNS